MSDPVTARVAGSNPHSAVVIVGDVRVRVKWQRRGLWTRCDAHPKTTTCEHVKAATKALEERKKA